MYAVIYAPNCKEHYVSTNDLKGHTCYITTTQFFNKRHLDADFLFCIMISIVVSLCTFSLNMVAVQNYMKSCQICVSSMKSDNLTVDTKAK